MVDLATRMMVGEKLREQGYGTGLYRQPPYVAVKVPVFSFEKLVGVNATLSPEMKSTGEVLGVGATMAEAMFKREFWDRLRLDDMPFRPACALYDAAVNSGCAQSVRLAQRGYNACVGPYGVKIEVDGILGPRTRASLACDTDVLIRAVIQARRAFYEGLARDKPSQAVFLEGWLNRADALEKFLLAQRRA